MENFNYHERLNSLKLYSMQRRREQFLIIHIFKIEKSLTPNNLHLVFYDNRRFSVQCRRKLPKLKKSHLYTQTFNSFPSVGPALYNLIPRNILESQTLETFKSRLDKILLQIPDQPPLPSYPTLHNNSLLNWLPGDILSGGYHCSCRWTINTCVFQLDHQRNRNQRQPETDIVRRRSHRDSTQRTRRCISFLVSRVNL